MVLDLATMWDFHEVRTCAIRNMSQQAIDTVQKVCLANKYQVTEWYRSAYFAISSVRSP